MKFGFNRPVASKKKSFVDIDKDNDNNNDARVPIL